MTPPDGIERRKSDVNIDDPIDADILREIRLATDDAEKRRLMIDYQINRQLWRLGTLVSDISAKISKQDETFEQHRAEIKAILANAKEEYEAHRKEFMQHAKDEEKLISNGQTAYKVVATIGGAVVVLSWYILAGHFADLRTVQDVNAAQTKLLNDVERRVELLDRAFTSQAIKGREPQQAVTSQNGLRLPER